MLKPYLVIKLYQSDYYYKLFETMWMANGAVEKSNWFPGDYICVYNLSIKTYVHIETFTGGINNSIHAIVEHQKSKYLNTSL